MHDQITSPALEMLMKQDVAFLEQATSEGFLTVDEATRCREIQQEVLNSSSRYERVSRIVMMEGFLSSEETRIIEQKLLAAEIDIDSAPQDVAGAKKEVLADKPEDLGVMIVIEEGPFVARTFASPEGERTETIHVRFYAVDRFPVTNKEFEQFLHQTGGLIPQHWVEGKIPPGKEYHPVTGISWHDAARYADWCGKRLPTKWEWEKAAGGPDGLIYSWGNAFKAEACHSLLSPLRDTTPVHAHPEGVSPYGCLDMCGNIWEWTADTITRIEEETIESFRIVKGGSFYCGPLGLRVGAYSKAYDRMKDADLGFRCVMDVAEGVGPVIMPTKPGDAITEAEAARRAEALRLPQQVPTPVPVQSDSGTLAGTAAYPPTQPPVSGSSRRTVVATDSGRLGEFADSSSDIHSSPTVAMSPSESGGSSGSSQTAAISDMDTIAMSPQEVAGDSDLVGTHEAMGIFNGVDQQEAPPTAPPPPEPLPPDAAEQDIYGAETMAIPPAEAQLGMQQESTPDREVVDLQLGAGADATQAQPQPEYDEYQQPQPGYEGYQQPQPAYEDYHERQAVYDA
ncbi:MAG: hypothetical protein E3J72_05440 [Planctomycetota bacterium]|nr:MAG: hypothetical protein E3J72_05440 [Planctomycetota bacterium]